MKLTFVFKKDRKLLTFPTIESVAKELPDADLGFLHYVRALTLNLEFRNLIQKHRKEFGIPEVGFKYKDRAKVPYVFYKEGEDFKIEVAYKMLNLYKWKPYNNISIGESIEKIFSYISLFNRVPVLLKTHLSWSPNLNIDEDMYKVFNKMLKPEHRYYTQDEIDKMWKLSPNDMLKSYEQEILSHPYFDLPTLAIQINIDSPLSLNNLTRYLKKNWKDIEYYLSKMDNYNNKSRWKDFYISDRDIEIVEMHRFQNKTFREIGDEYERRGNFDLYEDNVKTAYHRAIKKIDDLVIPKV